MIKKTLRKKDNLLTDYEKPVDNKSLLKAHGDLDSNWLQYITCYIYGVTDIFDSNSAG